MIKTILMKLQAIKNMIKRLMKSIEPKVIFNINVHTQNAPELLQIGRSCVCNYNTSHLMRYKNHSDILKIQIK
jgi:hypothetical protein